MYRQEEYRRSRKKFSLDISDRDRKLADKNTLFTSILLIERGEAKGEILCPECDSFVDYKTEEGFPLSASCMNPQCDFEVEYQK